jgi:hypothetical protein
MLIGQSPDIAAQRHNSVREIRLVVACVVASLGNTTTTQATTDHLRELRIPLCRGQLSYSVTKSHNRSGSPSRRFISANQRTRKKLCNSPHRPLHCPFQCLPRFPITMHCLAFTRALTTRSCEGRGGSLRRGGIRTARGRAQRRSFSSFRRRIRCCVTRWRELRTIGAAGWPSQKVPARRARLRRQT